MPRSTADAMGAENAEAGRSPSKPRGNPPGDPPRKARRHRDVAEDLRTTVERASARLRRMPSAVATKRPAPEKWSPIEVLGHLIDSASNNHQRFVRARFQEDLRFDGYPQDAWVSAQAYSRASWTEIVELWRTFNLHLAHVMEATPRHERVRPREAHNLHELAWEEVPAAEPVTLEYFMRDYVGHLKHHLRQIDVALADLPERQRAERLDGLSTKAERPTSRRSNARRSNARRVIAFATDGRTTDLAPDDAVALTALADRNLARVEAVAWDAPHVEWSRYHAVLIRSTWDYHLRLDAFLDWAESVEAAGGALWNPASVIRWNADKRYLREIERVGVPVVPTRWIHRGTQGDGGSVLRDTGWQRVVVKPSVSATAFRTSVTDARGVDGDPELLSAVLAQGDAMVQPFLPEVCETGEWSFMYFANRDGDLEFSHAVLKQPAAGDFRVQDQFGGAAVAAKPPDALVHQATEAAAAVARAAPGPLLYARIDGVESGGDHAPRGTFLLMEAELIEPVLFLGAEPDAANRFAAAIARRVDRAGAAQT